MLNMFFPQAHLCPKSLQPLSKKWLNLAKWWLFISAVQDAGLKIVNHWHKRDNGVLCTGKEIKVGLKLARMETDVATDTCKLLSRKSPEYCDINIVLLQISVK